MTRILCRIFFLLRKACMYGTKIRSSSKRSLKGMMTAILWGPHEESSTVAACLSKRHGWWGGPSASSAWFRSDEQLSCSQRREPRASTMQRPNSFSTVHFFHRNLKQKQKSELCSNQTNQKRTLFTKLVSCRGAPILYTEGFMVAWNTLSFSDIFYTVNVLSQMTQKKT